MEEHTMTKQEYKRALRIIRDNGQYGLKWISSISQKVYEEFYDYYWNIYLSKDKLEERASIVAYCKRTKLSYNFRQIQ